MGVVAAVRCGRGGMYCTMLYRLHWRIGAASLLLVHHQPPFLRLELCAVIAISPPSSCFNHVAITSGGSTRHLLARAKSPTHLTSWVYMLSNITYSRQQAAMEMLSTSILLRAIAVWIPVGFTMADLAISAPLIHCYKGCRGRIAMIILLHITFANRFVLSTLMPCSVLFPCLLQGGRKQCPDLPRLLVQWRG